MKNTSQRLVFFFAIDNTRFSLNKIDIISVI